MKLPAAAQTKREVEIVHFATDEPMKPELELVFEFDFEFEFEFETEIGSES